MNTHLPSSSPDNPPQDSHTSHTSHTFTPHNTPADLASLGLSLAGIKTTTPNPFMTPGSERERRSAEHQFLHQLAALYPDPNTRRLLGRHFRLYKETTLFIIFSVLLKDTPELHKQVKGELKRRLLTDSKLREEYRYKFSRAFYDEYQRNKTLSNALSYMFWSVLTEKYPDKWNTSDLRELMNISGLFDIYKFTHNAIHRQLTL